MGGDYKQINDIYITCPPINNQTEGRVEKVANSIKKNKSIILYITIFF